MASSSGDTVALALGGYYLTSSDRLAKVLWAEVEISETEMVRGAASVVMDDAAPLLSLRTPALGRGWARPARACTVSRAGRRPLRA